MSCFQNENYILITFKYKEYVRENADCNNVKSFSNKPLVINILETCRIRMKKSKRLALVSTLLRINFIFKFRKSSVCLRFRKLKF